MSDTDKLPSSLIDVAEALGVHVAMKLMQHYGGLEVRFPVKPPEGHPVMRELGKEDAIALCNFLSGGMIYVPHGRSRKSVRQDVVTLQGAGKNRQEIARILGVSMRHVRRMANREEDSSQMNLFGD